MLRGSGKLKGWIAAASCLFAVSFIAAQAQAKSQFIQASDAGPGQNFGSGVSGDGNLFAVVAPRAAAGTSAVYIFAQTSGHWVQQAEITPPPGTIAFGLGLALQGNTFVIDALEKTATGGVVGDAQVYTLINGAWIETAVLNPAEPHGGFGSIAMSGNTVALGAGSDTTAAGPTGAVYIFVDNGGTWTEQAQLAPSDPQARGLGSAVSIDGDLVLAGAPLTDVKDSFGEADFNAGEAFIFSRTNDIWTQQAVLTAPDPDFGVQFSASGSISGTSAAIGAFGAGDDDAGRAYVFVDNGGVWSLQQELEGQGVLPDGDFGFNIGILGDTLLVGAYEDESDQGAGDAHVFKRNNGVWTETQLLKPANNGVVGPIQTNERFADFLTIIGPETSPTFVIGAPTFGPTLNTGAVYVIH